MSNKRQFQDQILYANAQQYGDPEAVRRYSESPYHRVRTTELVTGVMRRWRETHPGATHRPLVLNLCGGNNLANRLFTELGADVVLADYSKEALRRSRAEGSSVLQVRLDAMVGPQAPGNVQQWPTRLPFQTGSFDIVVSLEFWEHAPYPKLVMGEMHRILASDGVCGGTTPEELTGRDRIRGLFGKPSRQVHPDHELGENWLFVHIRPFSSHSLRELLAASGFVTRQMTSNFVNVPGLNYQGWIARQLARVFPSLGGSIIVIAEKDPNFRREDNKEVTVARSTPKLPSPPTNGLTRHIGSTHGVSRSGPRNTNTLSMIRSDIAAAHAVVERSLREQIVSIAPPWLRRIYAGDFASNMQRHAALGFRSGTLDVLELNDLLGTRVSGRLRDVIDFLYDPKVTLVNHVWSQATPNPRDPRFSNTRLLGRSSPVNGAVAHGHLHPPFASLVYLTGNFQDIQFRVAKSLDKGQLDSAPELAQLLRQPFQLRHQDAAGNRVLFCGGRLYRVHNVSLLTGEYVNELRPEDVFVGLESVGPIARHPLGEVYGVLDRFHLGIVPFDESAATLALLPKIRGEALRQLLDTDFLSWLGADLHHRYIGADLVVGPPDLTPEQRRSVAVTDPEMEIIHEQHQHALRSGVAIHPDQLGKSTSQRTLSSSSFASSAAALDVIDVTIDVGAHPTPSGIFETIQPMLPALEQATLATMANAGLGRGKPDGLGAVTYPVSVVRANGEVLARVEAWVFPAGMRPGRNAFPQLHSLDTDVLVHSVIGDYRVAMYRAMSTAEHDPGMPTLGPTFFAEDGTPLHLTDQYNVTRMPNEGSENVAVAGNGSLKSSRRSASLRAQQGETVVIERDRARVHRVPLGSLCVVLAVVPARRQERMTVHEPTGRFREGEHRLLGITDDEDRRITVQLQRAAVIAQFTERMHAGGVFEQPTEASDSGCSRGGVYT